MLLSQVYCVWQVVKTPTVISNNPVFALVALRTNITLSVIFSLFIVSVILYTFLILHYVDHFVL